VICITFNKGMLGITQGLMTSSAKNES